MSFCASHGNSSIQVSSREPSAVNQNHGIFLKGPRLCSRGPPPPQSDPNNTDTDTLTSVSEDRAGSH